MNSTEKLAGGGDNKELEYTHTLQSVDVTSYQIGFMLSTFQGSLTPNTINGFSIALLVLQNSNRLLVTLTSSTNEYPQELYLGFTYNKIYSDIPYSSNYTTSSITYYYYVKTLDNNSSIDFKNAFTFSKETPQTIWLSTTPPPWYEDDNGHSGGGAQIG